MLAICFFADDCLIFAKANIQGARQDKIIKNFSKYSGQSINYEKSGFFDNYQVLVNATVQQIKKSILDWNEYVAKITANHSQVSSKGPGVSQQ
ncbi:uncharacterized protein LOC113335327 isoform X3 [Papaver somniferum]|uniref:uncharacterized protein LOC113335327 isoform X3 n=1 Tax=Papaver somniferum TaxID=3469 RepID=UPI000E6FEC60|nr:uncharacterized protein LOC113335327 isoform X3 [Papaver somniferum]